MLLRLLRWMNSEKVQCHRNNLAHRRPAHRSSQCAYVVLNACSHVAVEDGVIVRPEFRDHTAKEYKHDWR